MVGKFRAILGKMYVYCSDVSVHVYTSNSHCESLAYKRVHNDIVQTCACKVCVAYVLCTDGYIHFTGMKCTDIQVVELCTYTDISFWLQLFYSPC
jgi:hypothetical protein